MRLLFPLIILVSSALLLPACGNSSPSQSSADHQDHDDHDHGDEHDDHSDHDDDETLDADNHGDHDRGDHDGHTDDDHGDDEHSDHVELSPDAAREAGIIVSVAEIASAGQTLSLPAELRFDADRVAAVSPLVSGRLERLLAGEGDTVSRGDTLALLSSRELAELKAEYLSAATAETLARQALLREETLFADRITSEADLETARAALAAARAQREGAENKLHAVGVSDAQLANLSEAPDGSMATIPLRAPIGGVIARRTATLGATVSADDPAAPALFTIVDDRVLWADIAVYKQSTGSVQVGSTVVLKSETGTALAEGEIATVLPAIDETSRTATARMIVDNPDGRLRPGQFVTADISVGTGERRLQVPSGAIVEVEGRTSVFVPTEDGFEPAVVVPGIEVGGQTVILSGLSAGDAFVSEGAFTLKAQLEKDAFGDDHDH